MLKPFLFYQKKCSLNVAWLLASLSRKCSVSLKYENNVKCGNVHSVLCTRCRKVSFYFVPNNSNSVVSLNCNYNHVDLQEALCKKLSFMHKKRFLLGKLTF